MGIFKWKHLFKKRIKSDAEEEEQLELETEKTTSGVRVDRSAYDVSAEMATLCEQFIDATYQMEDLRVEYDTVGYYFDDIQRIEQMPDNLRSEVNSLASRIEFLEQNQEEFKKMSIKLTDDKFRMVARYETDIPEIMRQLMDVETRNTAVKRDMQYLENEKVTQDYFVKQAKERQYHLRSIAVSVAIMGVITIITFLWLSSSYRFDMQLPSMITLFVITVVFVLLYLKYRDEEYEIQLSQARANRAITLLNKVKVKYVNTASTLDYIYTKYQIRSLRELEYLWAQYSELVQETRKFRQTLGDLRVYCDDMEKVLRQVDVRDPYIWTQQTRALLDDREMVEVKHELNVRRQKLRSQMEYNDELKTRSLKTMKEMVTKEPALMETIREILAAYHIDF